MTEYVKQLAKLARAYRAAEEAVVSAFFAVPRKKLDHLHWLRAQAFKEYSAIKPIFSALAKLYPEVDRQIDRHQFEELTEKLADETKHARLVMDLLEELTGKKVTFADLLWLPEDRKLAKIRARYSKSLAKLLHGNNRQCALYPPTVVDHVPHDCELVHEETFGPVIPLIRCPN